MKTIKRIVNFVRKYRWLARAFAILNSAGIAFAVFYVLSSFAGESDWRDVFYIVCIVSASTVLGIVGSLSLWFATTRLMQYWPLIIILYIPCFFYLNLQY